VPGAGLHAIVSHATLPAMRNHPKRPSRALPAPLLPGWLAVELPFDRYVLPIDGHTLHVMEAGDPDGRPVLMLHGNPTWGFLWRKVARRLEGTGLRLVMPDLVGLGFSDKPRDPHFHQLTRHAGLIARLLDELELSNLLFVGQDWGGPIGLCAIAEQPSRLTGMVLLNTVVGPPRPGFKPTPFHRFARMPWVSDIAFRGLGFPQTAMWAVQGDKQSIRGVAARAYRYPLRKLADNVAPLSLARMVPDSQEHPSIAALKRSLSVVEGFRGPAEIVWGDRDPVLGRVRTHIERLLPNARVTRTAAGHFLQEEVPDEIAEAIARVAGQS
jgi:pimeloyl-ACP methyl ester carboxylesterase